MRILADFHHSTLLRSLYMLFEGRMGHELYRPIGMEWFFDGYWAINNQHDTAEQFLGPYSKPKDNTPPLNEIEGSLYSNGWVNIPDEGIDHKACTLEFFKNTQFDILIASLPQHIRPFKELIEKYHPHAKLIVQLGNDWPLNEFEGMNVMASIYPRPVNANVIFYHQEFDTSIFQYKPFNAERSIYSFINILQNANVGWQDFLELERAFPDVDFRSYGGQCRDGNIDGTQALADKMHESSFIFHVKDGGDGYGHIIHNAYACGRPVITRRSFYRHKLAEQLLVPNTFIDIDMGMPLIIDWLGRILNNDSSLENMGQAAAARFKEIVDFEKESEEIALWMQRLN